ncbi:PTS sugar transporter subunit IIA [Salisaeta longa]|uniref:PTS sugar transporter subunit IIA n=1 Tax=Salisaeta longa TaxID=503170 RepID=UPI0003B2E31F|nr:PTS sugar transporter subunit IIA [Salisaeta longa]
MSSTRTTDISQLLEPSSIRIALEGASKDAVIDALVDVLRGHPAVDSIEAVRRAVKAREAVMSTGVGKGLALPHAKTDAVRETVGAFAITQQGIDYGAIDSEPVRLVLLLVGPEADKSQHIKILGRISRLVGRSDVREELLAAASPEAVIRALRAGEATLRG